MTEKIYQCAVDGDGRPTCRGDGTSCGPDGLCWSFRFPDPPSRHLTVDVIMPGVIRVSTNVPLDQPELNHKHMIRDMDVTEAVELIRDLGEAVTKALRMRHGS